MSIKITADSTCDLAKELLDEYNINIIPLSINMGGKSYYDGVEIFPEDIFRHVAAGGEICTTSAINITDYEIFFEKMLEGYDALIHITISSGFSCCFQNAISAAEKFDNVYVIDSENLSTGHGLAVLKAAELARTGADPKDICDEVNLMVPKIEASFIINSLDYMRKGGRCSSVAALGANLLKLKPCIEVVDGKMQVGKKYRGSFSKCLAEYVKDRLSGRDNLVPDRLFITHTETPDEIVQDVFASVETHGNFKKVTETIAGSTITCHCGPNTLGILFVKE